MYCNVCKKDNLEMREINKMENNKKEEIVVCDKCLKKLLDK